MNGCRVTANLEQVFLVAEEADLTVQRSIHSLELKFEDWQPREVRTQKQQDVVLYPEQDDFHLPQWPQVAQPKLNLLAEDDDDYQLAVVQVNPAIYAYDSSAELAKLQLGTKPDTFSSKHQRESPTLPETPQEDFRPPSFSENTTK